MPAGQDRCQPSKNRPYTKKNESQVRIPERRNAGQNGNQPSKDGSKPRNDGCQDRCQSIKDRSNVRCQQREV
jgi:hypothetical protein